MNLKRFLKAARRIRAFVQANLAQGQAWHYGDDEAIARYARENPDLAVVHAATLAAGKNVGTRPEAIVVNQIAGIIRQELDIVREN